MPLGTKRQLKDGDPDEMIADFLEQRKAIKNSNPNNSLVFSYEGSNPSEFLTWHATIFADGLSQDKKLNDHNEAKAYETASSIAKGFRKEMTNLKPSNEITKTKLKKGQHMKNRD